MHERAKLEEARYFHSLMQRTRSGAHGPYPLLHQMSAFLSAARSVLQYAHKEADRNQSARAWYQASVDKPVIRFFKAERDLNIHQRPTSPARRIEVELAATVRVEDSVSIVVRNREGEIVQTHSSESKSAALADSETEPDVRTAFFFLDWTGSEDVLALAALYLDELGRLVDGGVQAGFITG